MASRSINRVILLGNLTRNPELKHTPNGTAVCSFGLATNRAWTTSDGHTKEEAQYHRIVAWQKLAELCIKLLVKGKKVYVEGRITYREYNGKDGQKRLVAEIVMDDFIVFNDGKKNGNGQDTPAQESELGEDISIPTDEEVSQPIRFSDEDIDPKDIPF